MHGRGLSMMPLLMLLLLPLLLPVTVRPGTTVVRVAVLQPPRLAALPGFQGKTGHSVVRGLAKLGKQRYAALTCWGARARHIKSNFSWRCLALRGCRDRFGLKVSAGRLWLLHTVLLVCYDRLPVVVFSTAIELLACFPLSQAAFHLRSAPVSFLSSGLVERPLPTATSPSVRPSTPTMARDGNSWADAPRKYVALALVCYRFPMAVPERQTEREMTDFVVNS